MKVLIDNVEYVPLPLETTTLTLADVFEHYRGATQWDSRVTGFQKWFYETSNIPKTAWCATSLCFMLAQMGLLKASMDKKQENVYNLYMDMKKKCIEVSKNEMRRGDVAFFLWSGTFTSGASKHVSVYDGNGGFIGGNQGGRVQTSYYDKTKLIHVLRPDYQISTLKSLGDLPLAPR